MTLKIGDFGISRILQASAEMAKTCVGSPCYLSPEIVQGAAYGSSRRWSLGVIVYRAMTNRFPFDADNLAQLALKITAGSFPPAILSARRRRTTSSRPCSRSTHPTAGMADVLATNSLRPARPRPPRRRRLRRTALPAAAALTARSRIPVPQALEPRPTRAGCLPQPPPVLTSSPHQLRRRLLARRAVGDAAVGRAQDRLARSRPGGQRRRRLALRRGRRARLAAVVAASAASAAAPSRLLRRLAPARVQQRRPAASRRRQRLPPRRAAVARRSRPRVVADVVLVAAADGAIDVFVARRDGAVDRPGSPRARSLTGSPLSTPGRRSPRSPSPGAAVRRAGSPGPQARPSAPKRRTPKTRKYWPRRRPPPSRRRPTTRRRRCPRAVVVGGGGAARWRRRRARRGAQAYRWLTWRNTASCPSDSSERRASRVAAGGGTRGDVPEAAARLTPRSRDAFMLRLQRAESNDAGCLHASPSATPIGRFGGSVGASRRVERRRRWRCADGVIARALASAGGRADVTGGDGSPRLAGARIAHSRRPPAAWTDRGGHGRTRRRRAARE